VFFKHSVCHKLTSVACTVYFLLHDAVAECSVLLGSFCLHLSDCSLQLCNVQKWLNVSADIY